MANNQKDNKSGDSRLGQDKNRGTQSGKQGSNNPSGESRGQNPGALHKSDTGLGRKQDRDDDARKDDSGRGSRM